MSRTKYRGSFAGDGDGCCLRDVPLFWWIIYGAIGAILLLQVLQ